MSHIEPRPLELLAPARNAEIALAAIDHGADAIYMGASSHGARAAASNSIEDIGRVADYCHRFDARLYVTLNTLIYEHELKTVEKLIKDLYRANVDALIVQDLGILRLDIPPIALHASTQCDIRDVATARLLKDLGFSQLVLARELSLKSIKEIHEAVDVPLEAFVHGALCVSYSGCCRAGFHAARRSGNRGECPQVCRLPYTLVDGDAKPVIVDRHLLSLKDMNRLSSLSEMCDAGVSSFKIEGRLKDIQYVKNVVAAYRIELDKIIDSSDSKYVRASQGRIKYSFQPDLSMSFNRGYTDYFLTSSSKKIGSHDTPKMAGTKIGKIIRIKGNCLDFEPFGNVILNHGDGLGFFDCKNVFHGFRLNRKENNFLFAQKMLPPDITEGTYLYRNYSYQWEREMEGLTAQRAMEIEFKLSSTPRFDAVVVEANDLYGNKVTVCHYTGPLQQADKPQHLYRQNIFGKLGGTGWTIAGYSDNITGYFIQASVCTLLRRKVVYALESVRKINRKIDYRKRENRAAVLKDLESIDNVKNIANSLSKTLFKDYSFDKLEEAVEISKDKFPDQPLMECKYCLRRELDDCLQKQHEHDGSPQYKEPLSLYQNGRPVYRLRFDCSNCSMKVYPAVN